MIADPPVREPRAGRMEGGGARAARTAETRGDGIAVAILAAVTYVPLFLSHHGTLDADTKQYLYLDPEGLLGSATNLWNTRTSGGTVTHQNIGYLWPMGPYYWVTDQLGIPDWVAQRFWMGTIMFLAATGAYHLFRTLWGDRRAAVVGALAYGLSPFVLGHITGQSALLLPFSALPWLIIATRNSLRGDPWRWAAVFALVTTTAGSLNGSSTLFVLFGAVLWIPYAVWCERTASVRSGVTALLRMAGLTLLTQLWWLMALRVGGSYGLPILQVTETVRETSSATSGIEVFRGLGYWFFYGGDNQGPWLRGLAPDFTQSFALLAVSFVVPLACVVGGWWSRFRERVFFVGLAVAGLLMSTVAFGAPDRSPVGSVFESMSRDSGLVLSLRNTQRAAALVVLGLAGLGTAGLTALLRRNTHAGVVAGVGVLVAALLTFSSPWSAALIAPRYERPEAIPQPWTDAARYLDRVGGRAMLVPGIDFATYRWGNTLDPVLAGLTRTELIWREVLPMGGGPGADLVAAFDQSIQEGWFDPRTVVPVMRALGVSHIVVANDLEIERYGIQRPQVVMGNLTDPDAGLELVATFGRGYVNQSPGQPIVDETELQAQHASATPLPEIAIFEVPGASSDPVTAYASGHETFLHGDGAGVLAAATAGLLDDGHEPLLSGWEIATWKAARRAARGADARHIVTDSNRKQVRRFTTLRENNGATQAKDGTPRSGIATDTDAAEFTGSDPRSQTIVELAGAESIDASAYGNVVSLFPEERPANAFDGDLRTSWRVDLPKFRALPGENDQHVRIDLGRRVRAGSVDVVQPQNRPGTQALASFDVVLDNDRVFSTTVDPAVAFSPTGTRVELDGKPFSTLEIRVPDLGYEGPVGIAEVTIPGAGVEELVRLPRRLGGRGDAPIPLAYVLTRLRADPSQAYRVDPELSMRRAFDVPAAMQFALSGTARINPRAADDTIDRVLGTTPAGVTVTSSEHLIGDPASRASAAVDGNPSTAWTTPLVGVIGQTWRAHVDQGFRVPALDLDLAVDQQHSLPTKLGITVDGVTREFAVPPLPIDAAPGAVTRVTYTPDQPLVGRDLTIEVLEIAPRAAPDVAGNQLVLPVAIAEVGLGAAAPLAAAPGTVVGSCRDDLLAVDGAPVPTRVTGEVGEHYDGRLAVETCDGTPLELAKGSHIVRTSPGLTTGIDLDQLALVSPQFSAASPASANSAPRVARANQHRAVIERSPRPYWLRLNQSFNRGWEATAHTRDATTDLGAAHPIDGFASGWFVEPSGAVTRVDFTWAPQRSVDLALLVSGLGVLACVVLIVVRRRRALRSVPESPELARHPLRVRAVPAVASAAVVIAGALFGSPVIGAALLVFAIGATFASRSRVAAGIVAALPVAAIVSAVGFVLWKQREYDYPHDARWPSYFGGAHALVLFGFLALALLVLAERDEDLHRAE